MGDVISDPSIIQRIAVAVFGEGTFQKPVHRVGCVLAGIFRSHSSIRLAPRWSIRLLPMGGICPRPLVATRWRRMDRSGWAVAMSLASAMASRFDWAG